MSRVPAHLLCLSCALLGEEPLEPDEIAAGYRPLWNCRAPDPRFELREKELLPVFAVNAPCPDFSPTPESLALKAAKARRRRIKRGRPRGSRVGFVNLADILDGPELALLVERHPGRLVWVERGRDRAKTRTPNSSKYLRISEIDAPDATKARLREHPGSLVYIPTGKPGHEHIHEMREDGIAVREIARRTGHTRRWIQRICNGAGNGKGPGKGKP
ncbi:hypothetical protein K8I61_17405 [bacterium]|nr:hypothetical protein [bacterium]